MGREDMLIHDGTFSLPRRKASLKSETEYEEILVDATESPIKRPKKAKEPLIKVTLAKKFGLSWE